MKNDDGSLIEWIISGVIVLTIASGIIYLTEDMHGAEYVHSVQYVTITK